MPHCFIHILARPPPFCQENMAPWPLLTRAPLTEIMGRAWCRFGSLEPYGVEFDSRALHNHSVADRDSVSVVEYLVQAL